MRHFICNGDADGLCALQQLRLEEPGRAVLVTGVKRDIELVRRVNAQPGDDVTVLDLSLDTNAKAVRDLLEHGVFVRYFDHHYPGESAQHAALELHIDTSSTICTSLIVNRYLKGKRPLWAAVGAFGDNLAESAREALGSTHLSPTDLDTLSDLGHCLNYNSYGESEADVLIPPSQLHEQLIAYESPLDFASMHPLFRRLKERYEADLALAAQAPALVATPFAAVYVLPESDWSRRVSGLWGNSLANAHPGRAHAVLTCKGSGGYVVSVRSAKAAPRSAVAFCRRYGGGGRESAAGINHLDDETLNTFCAAFIAHFQQ